MGPDLIIKHAVPYRSAGTLVAGTSRCPLPLNNLSKEFRGPRARPARTSVVPPRGSLLSYQYDVVNYDHHVMKSSRQSAERPSWQERSETSVLAVAFVPTGPSLRISAQRGCQTCSLRHASSRVYSCRHSGHALFQLSARIPRPTQHSTARCRLNRGVCAGDGAGRREWRALNLCSARSFRTRPERTLHSCAHRLVRSLSVLMPAVRARALLPCLLVPPTDAPLLYAFGVGGCVAPSAGLLFGRH